jgi:aminoglycoside phosphotransferase (APT) family kinase protein
VSAIADDTSRLAEWLARTLDGARLVSAERLSGGAIQQNWLLRLDTGEAVLRRAAPARIAESHDVAAECALLRAAAAAGVTVPAVLGFCDDARVIGAPFLLMERLPGVAFGPRVVKELSLAPDREALGARLGRELARLHRITPPRKDLAFLGAPPASPIAAEVARVRAALDGLAAPRPALEWGLRWAERQAPPARRIVLTHRDFRTGNYLLDAQGLAGVLDWEFAGWGDPMADLGWLCAACWRFGRSALEAGGVASRAALYEGYAAEAGEAVDDAAVRFWEVFAHLRWAAIALAQGWRHGSGEEPSLELALTGRLAAELELSVLRATGPAVATTPPEPALPRHLPRPETGGPALLEAARDALAREVLPALSGPARIAALMAASALGMAAREWSLAPALDAAARALGDPAALVEAIRSGGRDDNAALHAALHADAAGRAVAGRAAGRAVAGDRAACWRRGAASLPTGAPPPAWPWFAAQPPRRPRARIRPAKAPGVSAERGADAPEEQPHREIQQHDQRGREGCHGEGGAHREPFEPHRIEEAREAQDGPERRGEGQAKSQQQHRVLHDVRPVPGREETRPFGAAAGRLRDRPGGQRKGRPGRDIARGLGGERAEAVRHLLAARAQEAQREEGRQAKHHGEEAAPRRAGIAGQQGSATRIAAREQRGGGEAASDLRGGGDQPRHSSRTAA